MTEKDFVMAWLLATRAGSDAISFTDVQVAHGINQALAIYEQLENLNDTNNGVSDL